MKSESVSLSCPHILCYKKKRFSGLFLCTLNVSILKRSLHQSLFKMPNFFFLWAPRMYFVRSPVSAMVSLYFSCHHIDFFVDFFVDFELTQIHWHRQKKKFLVLFVQITKMLLNTVDYNYCKISLITYSPRPPNLHSPPSCWTCC